MSIVTVSRGTFGGGQSVAECVAEKLGYRCISREVLVEAARTYGVPLEKLSKALDDPPGFLERLTVERGHYLACLRAALHKEVKYGRVVYHGHAGHLLLNGIPHVLRVRIIADMEFRIGAAMERLHLSREEAIRFIKQMDDKRSKWTKFLYGVDWHDPSSYDLVINIERIGIRGACEIICSAVSLDEFETNQESQDIMDDLVLSTDVKARIAVNRSIADGGVEIEADGGVVTLGGRAESLQDADKIREMVRTIPGVKQIKSEMRVRCYG